MKKILIAGKIKIPFVFCSAAVVLLGSLFSGGCVVSHRVTRFQEFARLSGTMGDCLTAVYDEVSLEEWELRRREARLLDRIKPDDLEPKVFTQENRKNRSRICEYIIQYPGLLLSIVSEDSSAVLKKQADVVRDRIVSIQRNHPDWFSPGVSGVAAAVLGTIPEVLNSIKKRMLILRLMQVNHPLLSLLCGELAREMSDCRVWMDRCVSRRFRLEVSDLWPDQESRRDGFAKTGMKMLQHRHHVHELVDEVESGLFDLVAVHGELMKNFKAGKNIWPGFCRFSLALERMKRCMDDCLQCR